MEKSFSPSHSHHQFSLFVLVLVSNRHNGSMPMYKSECATTICAHTACKDTPRERDTQTFGINKKWLCKTIEKIFRIVKCFAPENSIRRNGMRYVWQTARHDFLSTLNGKTFLSSLKCGCLFGFSSFLLRISLSSNLACSFFLWEDFCFRIGTRIDSMLFVTFICCLSTSMCSFLQRFLQFSIFLVVFVSLSLYHSFFFRTIKSIGKII